jgi:hypothetical protein
MFAKIWPGLSLAIIIVLAVILIRGGCKTPPAPAGPDPARAYDSAKREDSPVIARLQVESDSLHETIDSLNRELWTTKWDLQNRAGDLSRTLAAADEARIIHDTPTYIVQCDTLRAEVKSGITAVSGYVHLSDTLINACVARGQIQDSIIARLTRLNGVADTTISRQRLRYEILNKDDMKKTVQLKFYKPVAIGEAAVIIGTIILKIIAK